MTLMPENPNTEPSCRSTSDHDREEKKEIENKKKWVQRLKTTLGIR